MRVLTPVTSPVDFVEHPPSRLNVLISGDWRGVVPRVPACLHGEEKASCVCPSASRSSTGIALGLFSADARMHLTCKECPRLVLCARHEVLRMQHPGAWSLAGAQWLAVMTVTIKQYDPATQFYPKYKFCFGMKSDPMNCIVHIGYNKGRHGWPSTLSWSDTRGR